MRAAADIHALEEDLLAFERKYDVRSETFYAAYAQGEEPEDPPRYRPGVASNHQAPLSFALGGSGSGKPFRVLVTSASQVGNPLPAQEGEVALHASFHRPSRKLAVTLAMPLTIENGRAQLRGIKVPGNQGQTLVGNRRDDHIAICAIESLAHRYIVNVVILDSGREQLPDDLGKRDGASQSDLCCFGDDFSVHVSMCRQS